MIVSVDLAGHYEDDTTKKLSNQFQVRAFNVVNPKMFIWAMKAMLKSAQSAKFEVCFVIGAISLLVWLKIA